MTITCSGNVPNNNCANAIAIGNGSFPFSNFGGWNSQSGARGAYTSPGS